MEPVGQKYIGKESKETPHKRHLNNSFNQNKQLKSRPKIRRAFIKSNMLAQIVCARRPRDNVFQLQQEQLLQ